MKKKERDLPLYRAILWIILSTVFFSGLPALGFYLWEIKQEQRRSNPKYLLKTLIQNRPYEDALDLDTLQQILGLNLEKNINLIDLDLEELEAKLLTFPLIERAKVRKVFPSKLLVSYKLRYPVAFLADFEGAALDREGKMIPLDPYYTPKNLPSVFLGLKEEAYQWGEAIPVDDLELIWELLSQFESAAMEPLALKSFNLSGAHEEQGGKREIIIEAEDKERATCWFLRLGVEHYPQGLTRFLALRHHLLTQTEAVELAAVQTVDLRLPQLAFLKPGIGLEL